MIEETILHPGTVRINVQGAFIVPEDEEPTTPQSEDYEHDPRDIRLPNHTSIVSHVAVDVCFITYSFTPYPVPRNVIFLWDRYANVLSC